MKILWEPFSFHQLSIPFARPSRTRPKTHRYVIAIALFALLFAQCFSHDSTTDKLDDSAGASQKKWLNDSIDRAIDRAPEAFDAKVAISKRQSPTKTSNSSSMSRTTRSYGLTDDVSTSPLHSGHSALFMSDAAAAAAAAGRTTFSPFFTGQSETQTQKHRHQYTTPANSVLILIQTKETIELNIVRDQFQQFTDMFGVQLRNISIDFDAIDGK